MNLVLEASPNDRYQLEAAISAEKAAYENYRDLAKIVKNQAACSRLFDFANEELGHFTALTKKYNKIFKTNIGLETAGRATGPLCDALWHFLSKQEKQNPNLKLIRIIELAMFEEKASIKMYTKAAEKTESKELKDFFLALSEVEKHHLNKLREEEKKIRKDNYWLRS